MRQISKSSKHVGDHILANNEIVSVGFEGASEKLIGRFDLSIVMLPERGISVSMLEKELTNSMEKIFPNFLCVGAQKAATTTFFAILKQHPEVFLPEKKELQYFNQKEYRFENSDLYSRNFEHALHYKIRAEFSPDYLDCKEAPDRILELLGKDVKILILLRNPVDRAFSQYQMKRERGFEHYSFEEAIEKDPQRLEMRNRNGAVSYHYLDKGLYTEQVKRYLDRFENVKIVLFEDFISNMAREMAGICEFLEIENQEFEFIKENSRKNLKSIKVELYRKKLRRLSKKICFLKHNFFLKKVSNMIFDLNKESKKPMSKINPTIARSLQDYYLEDIGQLEKLIERDLSAWKKKY